MFWKVALLKKYLLWKNIGSPEKVGNAEYISFLKNYPFPKSNCSEKHGDKILN